MICYKRALALLIPGFFLSSVAQAEIVGNIAVTNNYVWRGITQTADDAAVQGGLDYGHESGFYVGTWNSNVSFASSETDLYAGFASEVGELGYDIGYIYYLYPGGGPISFGEIYGSLSYGPASVFAAYTTNSEIDGDDPGAQAFIPGDFYISGSLAFPIPETTGLGLDGIEVFAGAYIFDEDDENNAEFNYTHYGVRVTKGDFALGVEINDLDSDHDFSGGTDEAGDPRFIVSYGIEF